MKIKDLVPHQGGIDLILTIIEKEKPRSFEKGGKQGRFCQTKAKDDSGIITFVLWNEEIDQVELGDKVHLKNGWCSEFKGEKQISTGKFGRIKVIEKAPSFLTNDPSFLKPPSLEPVALENNEPEENSFYKTKKAPLAEEDFD